MKFMIPIFNGYQEVTSPAALAESSRVEPHSLLLFFDFVADWMAGYTSFLEQLDGQMPSVFEHKRCFYQQ